MLAKSDLREISYSGGFRAGYSGNCEGVMILGDVAVRNPAYAGKYMTALVEVTMEQIGRAHV